jgi:ParB family transcriptional regulator, chromosome partitioning protein
MTMTMIPLNKLSLSPANVRKSDSHLRIDELADSIAERGLLNNLVATANKKKKRHFLVTAGGRRLRAMNRLVERGTWNATEEVACNLLEGDASVHTEISLMENYQRMNMTPCDEIRAFKHFINEGDDLDGVAKRFGETRRFIEGRLRLADLAEPVFAALDEGTITLDIAKAYASTASHDRQLMVWERFAQNPNHQNASTVRRLISEASLPSTSPIARFVGEAAYREKGGRIEGELFTTDGDKWLDAEIAYGLATDKLQAFAVELAASAGLAWVRPVLGTQISYDDWRDLYRVVPEREPLSDEEVSRLQALQDELADVEGETEDEALSEEQHGALNERWEALAAKIRDIEIKPLILTDEIKATSGCFVHLDSDGLPVVDPDYYTEVAPKRRGAAATNGSGDAGSVQGGESGSVTPADPADKPLSQKLIDELSVQRRDILALNLAIHPALALDYAIFVMATGSLAHGRSDDGSTISTSRTSELHLPDYPASRAWQRFTEMRDELDLGWTEHGTTVERFQAFQQLGDDMKAAILAFTVATTLKPSLGVATRSMFGTAQVIAIHEQLAAQMEIDSADWWRPTALNFFDRIGKAKLLGILHEVGGATLSSRHMSAKKGDIASSAERLFAGETIVEPETKETALRWVPEHMRFNVVAPPPEKGPEPDGEGDAAEVVPDDTETVDAGGIGPPAEAPADERVEELEPVA